MAQNDDAPPEGGEPVEMVDAPVKRVWGPTSEDDVEIDASGEVRKRERLTGKDIEAKWAEGSSKRAETAKKLTSPRSLRNLGTGALVLVALGAVAWGGITSNDYMTKSTANAATIKTLQQKVSDLDKQKSDAPDTTKVAGYLKDAQAMGAQVATTQNSFIGLGVDPQSTAKRKQLAEQMDGYLAKGNARNARVPWTVLPADADTNTSYNWRFVSVVPASGKDAKPADVEMLWTFNNSKTGDLISWATGVYDGDAKKVTKVTWGTTKQGTSLIPPTTSNDKPPAEEPDGPEGTAVPTPGASASSSKSPSAAPASGTASAPATRASSPSPSATTTPSR